MRKLLAFILGAFLALAPLPAVAGIVLINGGGTNGLSASGTCTSGGSCPTTTTVVTSVATTVDIPIGSLVVVGSAVRSASNGCSAVNDSAGNSYAGNGANKTTPVTQSGSLIWAVTTIDLPIGSTFTCTTVAGVTTNRAIMVGAWTGNAASPLDVSGTPTPVNGTGTVQSITGNTLACPGGGANCEVLVAVWTNHTLGAQSAQTGAPWVQFGCLTANNGDVCMAYAIVSAVTAQNFTSTNATSDGWAMLQYSFQAATGGGAPICTLSTLGVGGC